MGRKKKKQQIIKPWCWYCNREFETEDTLIQHQKRKHFRCWCGKCTCTASGLSLHVEMVHQDHLDRIPNALSHRNRIDIDIVGMAGIPPEDIIEHNLQKGLIQFGEDFGPDDNAMGEGNVGVKIVIKNLTSTVKEPRLLALFEDYGLVESCHIYPKTKDDCGNGIVCMTNEDEARTAVAELDGVVLDGVPAKIELLKPEASDEPKETSESNTQQIVESEDANGESGMADNKSSPANDTNSGNEEQVAPTKTPYESLLSNMLEEQVKQRRQQLEEAKNSTRDDLESSSASTLASGLLEAISKAVPTHILSGVIENLPKDLVESARRYMTAADAKAGDVGGRKKSFDSRRSEERQPASRSSRSPLGRQAGNTWKPQREMSYLGSDRDSGYMAEGQGGGFRGNDGRNIGRFEDRGRPDVPSWGSEPPNQRQQWNRNDFNGQNNPQFWNNGMQGNGMPWTGGRGQSERGRAQRLYFQDDMRFPDLKEKHLCICSMTLWVGHLNKSILEDELVDAMFLGKIIEDRLAVDSVNLIAARGCAYIVFATRRDASDALERLQRGFRIRGVAVKSAWAMGVGLKNTEFSSLWNEELGATYIPWDKLPEDIEPLVVGGVVDCDSVPGAVGDEPPPPDPCFESRIPGSSRGPGLIPPLVQWQNTFGNLNSEEIQMLLRSIQYNPNMTQFEIEAELNRMSPSERDVVFDIQNEFGIGDAPLVIALLDVLNELDIDLVAALARPNPRQVVCDVICQIERFYGQRQQFNRNQPARPNNKFIPSLLNEVLPLLNDAPFPAPNFQSRPFQGQINENVFEHSSRKRSRSPSWDQGPSGWNRGPPNRNQGPPNYNQNQGPFNLDQRPSNWNQNQGPPNWDDQRPSNWDDQGPSNWDDQGPSNWNDQGRPNWNDQGPSNWNDQGSSNWNQNRGPSNWDQGPPTQVQPLFEMKGRFGQDWR